ncbi:MAG: hypothetical protein IJ899_09340 [Blautia sp.]|nr:hypothetical protein [Blautia sp.]
MKNLTEQELSNVAGGNDGLNVKWVSVKANVAPGTYLALRTAAVYDDSNIICRIQPGEIFSIDENRRSGSYIWAAAHGLEGWANGDFMKYC